MGRLFLVLAVAALLASGTGADAHVKHHVTSTGGEVDYTTDTVSWDVYAVRAACIPGRRVTVTSNGAFWGQGLTNADGHANITGPDIKQTDTIAIIVQKRILVDSANHTHTCKRNVRTT